MPSTPALPFPPAHAAAGRAGGRREKPMAVTENQVRDALKAVRDPERGGDIISLGMISGVVVRDGNVGFAIEVEPERGARLEPLRKAAEEAGEAVPGVLSVTAVLTAEAKPPGGPMGGPRGAPRGGPPQPAAAQPGAGGESARAPGGGEIDAVVS